MKICYSLDQVIPRAIMESKKPKVKLGYASHLLECVARRVFLEAESGAMLNRIADSVLAELGKRNSVSQDAFLVLNMFTQAVDGISRQVRGAFATDPSEENKQKMAQLATMRFLANPVEHAALRKAIGETNKATDGNRVSIFISNLIRAILEKDSGKPIQEFKKQVDALEKEISRFYNSNTYPYQDSIKKFKDKLLGPNSLLSILEKISIDLFDSEGDIDNMASDMGIQHIEPKKITRPTETADSNMFYGHTTNPMYEAQVAFMEAFASSLDYFSRRIL